MADYKLYRLNGAGQIAGAPEAISAVDDDAALAEARRRCGDAQAELWGGRRLVGRLP